MTSSWLPPLSMTMAVWNGRGRVWGCEVGGGGGGEGMGGGGGGEGMGGGGGGVMGWVGPGGAGARTARRNGVDSRGGELEMGTSRPSPSCSLSFGTVFSSSLAGSGQTIISSPLECKLSVTCSTGVFT